MNKARVKIEYKTILEYTLMMDDVYYFKNNIVKIVLGETFFFSGKFFDPYYKRCLRLRYSHNFTFVYNCDVR